VELAWVLASVLVWALVVLVLNLALGLVLAVLAVVLGARALVLAAAVIAVAAGNQQDCRHWFVLRLFPQGSTIPESLLSLFS
jgi:hypothetical protein